MAGEDQLRLILISMRTVLCCRLVVSGAGVGGLLRCRISWRVAACLGCRVICPEPEAAAGRDDRCKGAGNSIVIVVPIGSRFRRALDTRAANDYVAAGVQFQRRVRLR